ncbi:uncharacterized protein LOC113369989 isoform X2 [Ctenocephalides felis]|nr:uncharacterized protein LOC113369989 isoform X2 [Ctenocephalides felis]
MGLKQEVTKLDKLLLDYNPQEYENNAQLQHYHIELLWKRGNIENATHSFLDMYQKFVQLRPKVLEMSLHMIFVLVPNGSDANLVMMTKFATNFYKKFNELQPLCLTWELSFLSEWFSDQVWSKQILEQCPEILDKVKLRLLPMANHSLQKHDVDTVQRILEIMLAYNLRNSYIILLHLLFDYKCAQNDLRGCTEIMNVAIAQGIPMRSSHHLKFLHLLLGKRKPDIVPVTKIHVPKYTLKF